MTESQKEMLMEELMEAYGCENIEEFLAEYGYDACVPGICTNPGCGYTTEYEPDQDAGWCDNCGENSVVSGLVLLGVI